MPHTRFLPSFESLRLPNGAFIAAPADDYRACWIRDHLYCTLAHRYLGDTVRFIQGLWIVFDIFRKYREKLEHALGVVPVAGREYLHAKVDPESFDEIAYEWGHHQLDAIGLFLFLVALAKSEGHSLSMEKEDADILQLLVFYLLAVRYFESPDNGMWEEELNVHTSSIGAVVAGLTDIKKAGLAFVPDSLTCFGLRTLARILPDECPGGTRSVDMAQLSLIWPYRIVSPSVRNTILYRVKEKLVQRHGLNRYWGDEYYRSSNGISAEWPMGFFWLAVIAADVLGDLREAEYWYERGLSTVTPEGHIAEAFQNGRPNDHTPLAWAHAMAIIAAAVIARLRSQQEGA